MSLRESAESPQTSMTGRKPSGPRRPVLGPFARRTGFLLLNLTILAIMIPAAPAMEIFVAPHGDDSALGSITDPLATLAAARDAVRRYRQDHPGQGIGEELTVTLRGGVYPLRETVVFSSRDSGDPARRITYRAHPGETPVLSGGVPVRQWRRWEPRDGSLPEATRDQIWVADVSFIKSLKSQQAASVSATGAIDHGWQFRTLFQGDRRLPRARGEGFSPTVNTPRGSQDWQTIHCPTSSLQHAAGPGAAELAIIPMHFWVSCILPVASIDPASGKARTAVPCTYPMGKNAIQDRPSAWFENTLPLMDEPGEWVLDPDAARLYLYSEGPAEPQNILVPVLSELIRVEGETDYTGPQDRPVRSLTFRGLTFAHADRFPWHGRSGWGLQHDWERFDSPSAAMRLRGCEDCVIEDCHFVNSGSSGLRLDLHCQENRIIGNHLEHLGGVGILLAGYGPGTKDVHRGNQIANNHVHHIGELYWGSPAIFVWQSGENRITNNLIHHTPYSGICVTGRILWDPRGVGECSRTVRWGEVGVEPAGRVPRLTWRQREPFLHSRNNLVARNDIHNVMRRTGDGNCIYVSGAGGGNQVQENYCHDCDGRYMNAAIRCDDDQHGTRIQGNVIHRTRGHGEGIISKGANDFLDNVIVDLRPDDQHRGYLVFPYGPTRGSTVQRNILLSCKPRQTICYEGTARAEDPPPRLRDMEVDFNLYHSTADPAWGQRHLQQQRALGIETHSLAEAPRFSDPDRADFRLAPGSPALDLGIPQPVPLAQIGLQTPYRERLLGRSVRTRIQPDECVLRTPTEITLESSAADARICYTLDGSEPDQDSLEYSGPFKLTSPAVLRARSFVADGKDLVGAVAVFSPPQQPLREDFESTAVGAFAQGASTSESRESATARISDEQAFSGRHSLKFIDAPAETRAFDPHVFYRMRFDAGRLVGRFRILADPATVFHYQWRDYQGSRYQQGPGVQIQQGGKVFLGGGQRLVIPTDRWVTFEVAADVGEKPGNTFEVRVHWEGADQPRVFQDLPCGEGLRQVNWLGLVANGQDPAVFYVDDLQLQEQ